MLTDYVELAHVKVVTTEVSHPKCIMKRAVPVTFSRRNKRATGIGVVIISISFNLSC
jgi:hypothetical protein